MKALLLTLLFLSPLAQADVLFLDLNNSPKEIEAARAAAKKSGRAFKVIPDPAPAMRQKATFLTQKGAQLFRKFERNCKGPAPECEKLLAAIEQVRFEKSELVSKMQFDKNKLRDFLAERERSGKPLSSIVVSGHDGTGHFSGDFGGVGDKELAETLEEFPSTKNGLRSLHLWGCYTTSPGSLMLNWKKHFPNVSLISGYDGRAPLNDKPAGWHYLKGVIEREPELLRIQDHKKLKAALLKIPGARTMHAAVQVCDNYATTKDSFNLREMSSRCETYKQQIQNSSETYDCFVRAQDDKCSDPPQNTTSGEVRQFYEVLHRAAACSEMNPDQIFRTYSRDQAIRLVFLREVRKNFARIFGKEIRETDTFLKELGAPDHLRFTGIAEMSRQELTRKTEELLKFVNSLDTDPMMDPASLSFGEKEAKLQSIREFQRSLTSTLINLSADCVPFNWTEPDKNDPSSCVDKNQLGYSGTVARLADSPTMAQTAYARMAVALYGRLDKLGSAGESGPIIKAQQTMIKAHLARLAVYQSSGHSTLNQENLAQAELQVKWAEHIFARVEAGVQNPGREPEALRIAHEYNRAHAASQVVYFKTSQAETLESLTTATGEENKKYYQEHLTNAQSRITFNEKLMELIDLKKEHSPTNAERLNTIELELGQQLLTWKRAELNSSIKATESLLSSLREQRPISLDAILTASSKKADQEQQLKTLESEPDRIAIELIDKHLTNPRFQDEEEGDFARRSTPVGMGNSIGFGGALGSASVPIPEPRPRELSPQSTFEREPLQ